MDKLSISISTLHKHKMTAYITHMWGF